MRVFVDDSVPHSKRDAVREIVAAQLAPTLKRHSHFSRIAVLVSSDARRGGWQITVVVLDPALTPTGAELPVHDTTLDAIKQALARI